MSDKETEGLHPTEQEVTDWFKENFGSALFPSESRKEWLRKNWENIVASGRCEESAARSSNEPEFGPEDRYVEETRGGHQEDLLERLLPDLVRYFETEPEGLYVTADPAQGSFEMEHSRAEIEALKNKMEELEMLVNRLAQETFRKTGQEPPPAEE